MSTQPLHRESPKFNSHLGLPSKSSASKAATVKANTTALLLIAGLGLLIVAALSFAGLSGHGPFGSLQNSDLRLLGGVSVFLGGIFLYYLLQD